MTIEQIAKKLEDCANTICDGCMYIDDPLAACQEYLIRNMADECRKLVEQMGDDGK